jgi:hypothetical protein
MAGWVDDQQHILYNAYFSQGATQAENDALLARAKTRSRFFRRCRQASDIARA